MMHVYHKKTNQKQNKTKPVSILMRYVLYLSKDYACDEFE